MQIVLNCPIRPEVMDGSLFLEELIFVLIGQIFQDTAFITCFSDTKPSESKALCKSGKIS
jgi:hypothetical protein